MRVLVLAFICLLIAASSAEAATLTLTPSSGDVGTSVRATGTGYGSRVWGTINFGSTKVNTWRSNRDGTISEGFAVPSGYAGATAVTAKTDSGSASATATFTVGTAPPPSYQCSDGFDNDSDTLIDYPADLGCTGATDNDETDAPPPPPPGSVDWSNGWGSWDAGNWPDSSWRPYAAAAPINSKWGESTNYVANDAAMVSRARNAHAVQETWATTGSNDWYHPYYFNHSGDPLYTIHCTTYACPTMEGLQLRIPNAARAAGAADAHMAILDQASGWEWDFYHAPVPSGAGGSYNVGGGGRLLISGDGIVAQSGATAANLGLLAGPVRPEELSAGSVPHALYMVVYCTNGTHIYPATGNARACSAVGQSNTDAPPDGQLFKLAYTDSEIDALAVPAWKKALLKALAHYGAYIQDTGGGGGIGFQFVSQQTYASFGAAGWNAFLGQPGVTGTTNSVAFDLNSGVDWSRLHAVAPCVVAQNCP